MSQPQAKVTLVTHLIHPHCLTPHACSRQGCLVPSTCPRRPMPASQKALREAVYLGIRRKAEQSGGAFNSQEAERIARELYPPKMVTRPREEVLPGTFEVYRLNNGRLEKQFLGRWHSALTDEIHGVLERLRANPTVLVEEDDS